MIFLFSLFETDQRWYCMELIIYVICLDTRYSLSHLMFMQDRQSCYVHRLLNRTHSCNCRWILLSWRKTLYVSLEFGRFRVFLHSYHFYSVSIGEQIERVIRVESVKCLTLYSFVIAMLRVLWPCTAILRRDSNNISWLRISYNFIFFFSIYRQKINKIYFKTIKKSYTRTFK